MADDIPIFNQKTAIHPGGGLPSVGAALGKKPEYQMDTEKSLADFQYYTDYAAKASQELGATLGKERGQTPGGFLVPPIFENQKAFHQAYKEEEYQNLDFEGKQSLQKMMILAARNPTKTSLQTFQKEGSKVVDELLEISSPGNQADLKRSLKGNYEASALRVAEANYNKEREEGKAQGLVRIDESLKNITNNAILGNKELTDQEKLNAKRNIDGMVQKGDLDGHQAYKMLDALDDAKNVGELQAKMQAAEINGDADEVIRDFRENRPKDMTPIKHEQYLQSMMQYHNNYQAALHGDQQLTYMGTRNQIQGGVQLSPTQLMEAKERMGPKLALDLDHDILQLNKKANDTLQLVNNMTPKMGDPVAMANETDPHKDAVYNHYLGQMAEQAGVSPDEIPLTAQAQLASRFAAPVNAFTEKLEAAVKYADAATATDAARAIRTLNQNSPITISKLDANAKATADLFDDYSRNTSITGEEALKGARNEVYNIDENTKKQRQEGLKQWYKDNELNDYNKKINKIAKDIGATSSLFDTGFFAKVDKTIMPAGIVTVADKLVNSMAQRTPNPDSAWKMAMDEIKKTYKMTETNGRKEMMALTPESTLPGGPIWQQNDKIKAVKELVDRNKQLREKGGFVYNELEWNDAPDTSNLVDKLLVEGDIKINIDGKPCKIIIQSDVVTQLSPIQQPTWQFNYIGEDGLAVPLMDMNGANAVARWVPDVKSLPDQIKKREARLLEEARFKKEHRNDTRLDYLNQVMETGIE